MKTMKNDEMSIGKRLRGLRKGKKMTLREESELFGVSLNSIYRWEHDLVSPKKTLLKKIADYYEVPYEWLRYGSEAKPSAARPVSSRHECSVELRFVNMFNNLSRYSKQKVLGYLEHMYVEELNEKPDGMHGRSIAF